ncbi:hypothetical protein SAMN04487909_101263 [Aneurinibacillus migulanus]|uniref:Uncharacterized protein n=1 Tax=Aneurinibacillus migulanus TaxID=47500 RepID=A0A1G8H5U9_ANEMI|nr:hypothetical protein AMI01nite_61620 [Aneurinibacillus migulanus]SDI01993.1 hypothetical protein SAMN04487909_101263 [Aneurinibacillus migulanus]
MRGRPEIKIETEKIYKTKKNPNGMFVARLIQIPKEEKLDITLVIQNRKTKQIIYKEVLVTTDNHYHSFRLARGNIKWVSLNTVAVWDGLGHKLVEVTALTGKENYRISDEHYASIAKLLLKLPRGTVVGQINDELVSIKVE